MNTVFSPSLPILNQVYNLWNTTVESLTKVAGIQYFIIFQRVPAAVAGNSLGLAESEGPLVLCLLSVTWNNAQDDLLVSRVAKTLIASIEQATRAAGLFNDYKYLNYAASSQDPLGSYGEQSVERLKLVSKKYDPNGIFQTRVPGGFKLASAKPSQLRSQARSSVWGP